MYGAMIFDELNLPYIDSMHLLKQLICDINNKILVINHALYNIISLHIYFCIMEFS